MRLQEVLFSLSLFLSLSFFLYTYIPSLSSLFRLLSPTFSFSAANLGPSIFRGIVGHLFFIFSSFVPVLPSSSPVQEQQATVYRLQRAWDNIQMQQQLERCERTEQQQENADLQRFLSSFVPYKIFNVPSSPFPLSSTLSLCRSRRLPLTACNGS